MSIQIVNDSTKFVNGILATGSLPYYDDYFYFKHINNFYVFPNTEYKLSHKLFATVLPKYVDLANSIQQTYAELHVYASGTAFISTIPDTKQYGKLLTKYIIKDKNQNLEKQEFNFYADKEGTATLYYYITAGNWYIADISLIIDEEEGFNPDYYQVYAPVPTWHRNDKVFYKTEIYDINNNKSTTELYSNEIFFSGSNVYIADEDNLLSGSMFIGNAINAGIEMAGKQSAYIRSIGYAGYVSSSLGKCSPGFMIWSGSVLPNSNETYNGVGLELQGGPTTGHALRFRTDTGRLEVTGDLYATNGYFSGTISASVGWIGGWRITSQSLMSQTNKVMLSGSGVISASNFYVSEEGNITGSSAYLSGSNIRINTPNYYLGSLTSFLSGSINELLLKGPNIELSSISKSFNVYDSNNEQIIRVGDVVISDIESVVLTDLITNGGFENVISTEWVFDYSGSWRDDNPHTGGRTTIHAYSGSYCYNIYGGPEL